MAVRKKRLKVILCAALTADGKLDADESVVPPALYERTHDPTRHPWGKLYDDAAAILVDDAARASLAMPQAAVRTVVTVAARPTAQTPSDAPRELALVLDRLRREGVAGDLLCFGGAELFRRLLEGGWVDELRLIVRPEIDGRRGAASLSGSGSDFFPASVACRLLEMEVCGGECLLRYRVSRRACPAGGTG